MSRQKKKAPKLSPKQKKTAIKIAKDEWGSMDEIAIGDNPELDPIFEEDGSLAGVWVQAWVFVHGEELSWKP